MMKPSQVTAASLLLASSFLVSLSTSLMVSVRICNRILRSTLQSTAKRRHAIHYPSRIPFDSLTNSRRTHLHFAPHNNFIHTDNLPWSPISEHVRTIPTAAATKILPYKKSKLQMNTHNTEGFREATRGGQGYITPRGGRDGLDDHGNRGAGRRGQPLKRKEPSNEVHHFPKLAPGHQHDINAPPPIKPSEEEKEQHARLMQMKQSQEARRTARLNILAENAGKKKHLMMDSRGTNIDVVEFNVGEEVCDALDAKSKDHCIENFRDGRESAQFMKVIGKNLGGADNNGPVASKSIGDSAVSAMDFLDDDNDDNGDDNQSDPSIYDEIDEQIDELLSNDSKRGSIKESTNLNSIDRNNIDRYEKIRGPLSEGFRNGARMATFKQPEFLRVTKGEVSSKEEEQLDYYRLDTVDEDFKSSFNDLEIDSDEDDLLIDGGGVFQMDSIISNKENNESERINIATTQVSESSKPTPTLLSIDPNSIDILPLDEVKADDGVLNEVDLRQSIIDNLSDPATGSFVKMFRGSASYIANHRNTLAVYHVPGELLAWEGFSGLVDDIALTWLLGMKIVLVAGCRHQIDIRLEDEDDFEHHVGGKVMMSSIRVTDEETLRVVKEEAGFVRFEIERRLAKSLRMHGGLTKGSENLVGNVVSGNFYSAQVGILFFLLCHLDI